MSIWDHQYGVEAENRLSKYFFGHYIPNTIEQANIDNKKEVTIKSAKFTGIIFYLDVALAVFIFYLLIIESNKDIRSYFYSILALIAIISPRIGKSSQRTSIIRDYSNDSITICIQATLKKQIRVYEKGENIYFKMFRMPTIYEAVPERFVLAILSGENITFLPFAVPPFPFYFYGRNPRPDSNWIILEKNQVESIIAFLNLPLVQEIGEMDINGRIDKM